MDAILSKDYKVTLLSGDRTVSTHKFPKDKVRFHRRPEPSDDSKGTGGKDEEAKEARDEKKESKDEKINTETKDKPMADKNNKETKDEKIQENGSQSKIYLHSCHRQEDLAAWG